MEDRKKKFSFKKLIICLIIIFILIFLYAKYIGTSGMIVKEYRVESGILTSNFSGLKIVHFSDLLYKSNIGEEDVKKMVQKINILKPDIVVFTGDLINVNVGMNENDITFLKEELNKIDANIGKYAVYGDYDYIYANYYDIMNEAGFKVLNNSYETIFYKTNEPLYLVGLPCSLKENVDMKKSFEFYSDEDRKYTIVLAHDGKTIKYIDDSLYEVDLILGGHSLNGSVVLPLVGGLFVDESSYKYSKPYYEKGITNIYISSGLGTNKYDYRFLNKPSFNLYRLKAQS